MALPHGGLEFTAASCGRLAGDARPAGVSHPSWRDVALARSATPSGVRRATPASQIGFSTARCVVSWAGGTACRAGRYGLLRSNAARASARDFVKRSCGFGRRLTARGSTRSGRWPTRCPARCWRQISINVAADSSSSSGPCTQLAAIFCMAAVKLMCPAGQRMVPVGAYTRPSVSWAQARSRHGRQRTRDAPGARPSAWPPPQARPAKSSARRSRPCGTPRAAR